MVVDKLRDQGEKVGLIKIRLFRPFPGEELAEALKNVKAVAIMDRAESFSDMGGPLGAEVPAALFKGKVLLPCINYIYGLGGRDLLVEHVEQIFAELKEAEKEQFVEYAPRYIGVRDLEERF